MRRPIRVVVVDDHSGVRKALGRVLEGLPEFSVVSMLADDRRLSSVLTHDAPDVVVLDHDLVQTDGLSLCLRIKRRHDCPRSSSTRATWRRCSCSPPQSPRPTPSCTRRAPWACCSTACAAWPKAERLLPAPAPDLVAAAAARLHAADLPVMAQLLDGARPAEAAHALAITEDEVMLRANRIVDVLQARRDVHARTAVRLEALP